MSFFWTLAWRNLWRNKRRTLATATAILVGYTGLCLLGGYIFRIERSLRTSSIYMNHSGHISLYKEGGSEGFYSQPKKYILEEETLQKVYEILNTQDEIEFVAPVLTGMGLLSNGTKSTPFLGTGFDPFIEKKISHHPNVKRWLPLSFFPGEKKLTDYDETTPEGVSITNGLGAFIGRKKPFHKLSMAEKDVQLAARTIDGDLNAVNATLEFRHTTGIALQEDTSLIAPLDLFQNLYGTRGITYLAIYLKENTSLSTFTKKLDSLFKNAQLHIDVIPFNDERIGMFYLGSMGFLGMMAIFFVFLIFSAVILTIINTLTIGILERKKEIATLKCLGFENQHLVKLFSYENLLLTLLSIGAGTLLAQIVAQIVNSMKLMFDSPGAADKLQFTLFPEWWLCLALAFPLVIISHFSSYFVSKRQMQQPIVQLMSSAS